MRKNKRWQLFAILAVFALTIYNILPTIFYYCQPLRAPIDQTRAEAIAASIGKRVDHLETEAVEWLHSFCNLIHVKPLYITTQEDHPQLLKAAFSKSDDAKRFRKFLAKSAPPPFSPTRLFPLPGEGSEVLIQRQIPLRLLEQQDLFSFVSAHDPRGAQILQSVAPQSNTSSFLAIDLCKVAHQICQQTLASLRDWNPEHPDFQDIPIVDAAAYASLPPEKKALCLVLYAPVADASHLFPDLRNQSIYVVANGIERILQTYQEHPDSPLAHTLVSDFERLSTLLLQNGFFRHPSRFLFEKPDYYNTLLKATREEFIVPAEGAQPLAILELFDVEQRLLAENKIETRIHEDLLKWHDEYRSAQVNLDPSKKFEIPKPTKSVLWSNYTLSARKLWRGDERKILRWGLDLSGGKTVQIELYNQRGEVVKSEDELKQGMNELYRRVGKMGMAEVSIRRIGHHIVLDFPGSQSLSAAELIQSSSMQFHIANEKFSPYNPLLADSVDHFLQEVWNRALVLHTQDPQTIHQIAVDQLGTSEDHPRSQTAQTLWDHGLRLASIGHPMETRVDESLSRIAVFRDTEIPRHTHPLLIVFHNFALEGSQLKNIYAGYDPQKGNYLSFEVQSVGPQSDLYSWTSRFSKEKVLGTPNEAYSRGHGWRMAIVLNGSIISAPPLEDALKTGGTIHGSFSQREVNQLAADLKAGSLSFTPRILSEKTVSPELGKADRIQGILATLAALFLIILSMIVYYRFAGIVASVAVLVNLFIMWAVLQNLGAALTLAGLAGIILTVGMAVDANVLVFERVKEEFARTKHIASALDAGYRKAFSAIFDSNLTTIIAALILFNFDAGPIKSFALNLIIGIASSMFTALFMTRVYFAKWLENPKHQALTMANWIKPTQFRFLKFSKAAYAITCAIILGGGALMIAEKQSIVGMDFTGGYAINLELAPTGNEAQVVEHALLQSGFSHRDFQVRELNPSNHLRLVLSTHAEEKELNSPTSRVIDALQSGGVPLAPDTLSQLHTQWTTISGQMSDTMRNNAILGLLLSFLCIFIYLAFRFESKFAAAALLCLVCDVLITLGVMGLLHALHLPLQIDLSIIAALMTIIGYSLNDKIIVFDRIREEARLMKGKSLASIVESALNATLSRTTITSGTTLLVLIALVTLGGPSIFGFSLVMTIGIFLGTLSSWFIAAPLLLLFHRRA